MNFPLPQQLTFDDGNRRLVLRPARAADVHALLEALHASLADLKEFMPWAHLPQTVTSQTARLVDLEAGYPEGGEIIFHAYTNDTDALVGCFGLHDRTLNSLALEIGYWVRSGFTGRGLATLGTQMLVALAFDHYGCERVQCAYNAANRGSMHVQRKVGFVEEGQLRYYEYQGDDVLRRNGFRVAPVTVMNALTHQDYQALPWREGVKANLSVEFLS